MGARPDARAAAASSHHSLREAEAARDRAIDTDLIQDPRWFDQGRPTASPCTTAPSDVAETRHFDVARFRRVARRAYWQHFRETPVSYNRPAREMS